MPKLIMLRHGQSEWNKHNLFTGWVDIPLSAEGVKESVEAGKKIAHVPIDLIFTSSLIRAQMTVMLAMMHHSSGKVPVLLRSGEGKLETWGKIHRQETEAQTIPVFKAWQLNERMYGDLQGLNKKETAARYGDEQVKLWRRSFDTPPPHGESLAMTAARTLPYFEQEITPHVRQGKNILIGAHGNSLRSIIMKLEGLSKEEVVSLEIATGEPIVYEWVEGSWKKSSV